ncbi:MAG: acyl-CoA thioesterase [Deltaproteobacteria bacterium]|nr:acyl-CoA thioesterase [Deltaproteobacteria bacterium]
METKAVSQSSAEFTHLVLPPDTNAIGTVFGGRLMEWIDIASAVVAMRHCRGVAVTASVDALHFISPIHLGDIVILKASVNYVHKTSMEIGVRIEVEDLKTGERRHTVSAYSTFVALDESKKPRIIPELIPVTDEEKRRFEQAKARREARLQLRQAIKK